MSSTMSSSPSSSPSKKQQRKRASVPTMDDNENSKKQKSQNKPASSDEDPNSNRSSPADGLLETLKDGVRQNLKKGWYRERLGLINKDGNNTKPKTRGANKTPEMSPIEKQQLLMEVILLEQWQKDNNMDDQRHHERDPKTKKFLPRTTTTTTATTTVDGTTTDHNPHTTKYLVQHAWGLGSQYISRLRKLCRETEGAQGNWLVAPMLAASAKPQKKSDQPSTSVIDDMALASAVYTAKHLYALNECRNVTSTTNTTVDAGGGGGGKQSNSINNYKRSYRTGGIVGAGGTVEGGSGPGGGGGQMSRGDYFQRLAAATEKYATLGPEEQAKWELARHNHLHRQPSIQQCIIESIRRNPNRSYYGIEQDIGHWCALGTIRKWVTSEVGIQALRDQGVVRDVNWEPPLATNSTEPEIKRKRQCRFPGCSRVIKSQGHCQRHGAKVKQCKIAGCGKQAQGTYDGMCCRHWKVIHATLQDSSSA